MLKQIALVSFGMSCLLDAAAFSLFCSALLCSVFVVFFFHSVVCYCGWFAFVCIWFWWSKLLVFSKRIMKCAKMCMCNEIDACHRTNRVHLSDEIDFVLCHLPSATEHLSECRSLLREIFPFHLCAVKAFGRYAGNSHRNGIIRTNN